ncbi:MAG: ketopantoate reductase family protein [Bacteroidetes bacterium]|nr:ketopantoate reductase family protein [Bacteroidota bacterium]
MLQTLKARIDSVYILGLGALGSIYAEKLYNMSPDSVRIIADPKRAKTLAESGFTINGKAYDFTYVSTPKEPAGLILVAVKSTQLLQAARDIRPFIGPDTIVLSLLNGISSEEIIGGEIGMEHLLYSYGLGMDAVREGNAIRYANAGRVVFGEKRNETLTPRVQAVKDLFERAEIPHQIPVDMQRALWLKFMMNTGINQVSAVLKAPYGPFQRDGEARRLMLSAAEEVLHLSRAMDIGLEPSDVDTFLKILDTLHPEGKTSMLQDIEAGRKSEVDLFAGTVIQLGKKYNVATPVNEMLYRLILALEEIK